jgi:hypothetical protein
MLTAREAAFDAIEVTAQQAEGVDFQTATNLLRLIIWIARRESDGRFAPAHVLRDELTKFYLQGNLPDAAVTAIGAYITALESEERSS